VDPTSASDLVAAALILAINAGVFVWLLRYRNVNRRRRRAGLTPIDHRTAGLGLSAKQLTGEHSDEAIAAALRLARQKEWERQTAAQEMVRYGRYQTRSYCSQHDRFCLHPEQGPHPPGGFDNPAVPDDWVDSLR